MTLSPCPTISTKWIFPTYLTKSEAQSKLRGMEQNEGAKTETPFFEGGVSAGFPIPTGDTPSGVLNLHDLCVKRPVATYFVRARGDSMIGAGIYDGDLLVVDRSLSPHNGDVVIAAIEGEFTVKRFEKTDHEIRLIPENPSYSPITIHPGSDSAFWGVVTSSVHFFRHA